MAETQKSAEARKGVLSRVGFLGFVPGRLCPGYSEGTVLTNVWLPGKTWLPLYFTCSHSGGRIEALDAALEMRPRVQGQH